jgi:hypothetical protein
MNSNHPILKNAKRTAIINGCVMIAASPLIALIGSFGPKARAIDAIAAVASAIAFVIAGAFLIRWGRKKQ